MVTGLNNARKSTFVFYLISLAAVGPASISNFNPAILDASSSLEVSGSAIQSSYTPLFLAWAIGQLVTGPIVDYIGARRLLVVSSALFLVGTVTCLYAPTYYALWLGRMLQGAAISGTSVLSRSIARDVYSGNELSIIFSTVGLVMNIVPPLALAAGGFLTFYFGWRSIFFPLLLVGTFHLIHALIYLKNTHRDEHISFYYYFNSQLKLLREPDFVINLLAGSFLRGAWFAYAIISPFIFQNQLGLDERSYSYIGVVTAVSLAFGSWYAGYQTKKNNSRASLIKGLFAAAISAGFSLLTANFAPSLILILASAAIFAFALGVVIPNTTARSMTVADKSIGGASGLVGAASMGTSAIVVAVLSAARFQSFFSMAYMMAGLTLVSALLLSISVSRWRVA